MILIYLQVTFVRLQCTCSIINIYVYRSSIANHPARNRPELASRFKNALITSLHHRREPKSRVTLVTIRAKQWRCKQSARAGTDHPGISRRCAHVALESTLLTNGRCHKRIECCGEPLCCHRGEERRKCGRHNFNMLHTAAPVVGDQLSYL